MITTRLAKIIDQRSAFNLVEALVVVAIIIALAGSSTWLLIGLTTVASDTNQRLQQYTDTEQVSGFLNTRLSLASSANIGNKISQRVTISGFPGLTTEPGILPTSWAGDQLFFSRAGKCYRIFHIKRENNVWVAESNSCSALVNSSGLARGPNQQINGSWTFAVSSPLYDPILDPLLTDQPAPSGVRLILLGAGIAPGNSAASRPLFQYYDVSDKQITTDAEATLGSDNLLYRSADGPDNVFAVKLTMNALGNPGRAANDQQLPPRQITTTIYPNQLCSSEGVS